MKCYECGNEMIFKNKYHYIDEYIGEYDIEDCEYQYCEKCNSECIPLNVALKIEKFEKDKIQELLKINFPVEIAKYLSLEEISKIENRSKEDILNDKAFNIWVYHLDKPRLYLKKSYEIHKKTGNIGFLKLYKE